MVRFLRDMADLVASGKVTGQVGVVVTYSDEGPELWCVDGTEDHFKREIEKHDGLTTVPFKFTEPS